MNSIYQLKIFTSGKAQFSMNVTVKKESNIDLIILINNLDWDLFQKSIFVDSDRINIESISKLVKNNRDDLVSAVLNLSNKSKSDVNATLKYMKNYPPWNPHYKIKMPLDISRYGTVEYPSKTLGAIKRDNEVSDDKLNLELWGSFKNHEKIPLKSVKIILIYDIDNKMAEKDRSTPSRYRGDLKRVSYEESDTLSYSSQGENKKLQTLKITKYVVNSTKTLDPGEVLSVPLSSQKWPFKLSNYFKFKFENLKSNTNMQIITGDKKRLKLYRKISSKSAIFSTGAAEIPGKSLVFDKSGNYLTNYYLESGSSNYHIIPYSENLKILCTKSVEISNSFSNYEIISAPFWDNSEEKRSKDSKYSMGQGLDDEISTPKDLAKGILRYYNKHGRIVIRSVFFDIIKTTYNLSNKYEDKKPLNKRKKKREIYQKNKSTAIIVHKKSYLSRIYKYSGDFKYYTKKNGDIIILTRTFNEEDIVVSEREKRDHVITIDARSIGKIDSLYRSGVIEKNLMLEMKTIRNLYKKKDF